MMWKSLSSLYLDDLSPDQHLMVVITALVTTVAILAGGCWTYRHRRVTIDPTVDLHPDGIHTVLLFCEYFHFLK